MSGITEGLVYLVGAGPGDPGLLTLRGAEVLGRADVVVYDHLASLRLLDLAPVESLKICAGKSIGHCTLAQHEINSTLASHARAGKTVVRLKGGDPFVFGRGGEEAEYLRGEGIRFHVVPGVTAGVGVTAYAGIPVTHRDSASAVAFVTGHFDPDSPEGREKLDWEALARFPGTLVFYMGVTRLAALCHTLIRLGKPEATPAALIQSGTLPQQRTVTSTLADLPQRVAEAGIGPPALFVVGEVVSRRPGLSWFEQAPLFGQRILVTRPAEDAARSAADLEALGAEVLLAPMVTIGPPADYGPLDKAIDRIDQFDWLVFTSGNGARSFLDRLMARGRDLRALGHLKLATIGPTTVEVLARFHLNADLSPRTFSSEGLAEALAANATGQRILLARADRGRALLKEQLDAVAKVEQVSVYTNADATEIDLDVIERLTAGTVDWVTLTSPAIAERFRELLPESALSRIGTTTQLVSLSPVTSNAAARLGWKVAAEARDATWPGIVRALVEHMARQGPDRFVR